MLKYCVYFHGNAECPCILSPDCKSYQEYEIGKRGERANEEQEEELRKNEDREVVKRLLWGKEPEKSGPAIQVDSHPDPDLTNSIGVDQAVVPRNYGIHDL